MKYRLLTVDITAEPKQQILTEIEKKLSEKQKVFIVTPNPEFIEITYRDYGFNFERILNSADFSLPDGTGILWAAHYLQIPLTAKSYYGKVVQAFWQLLYTWAEIIVAPRKIHSVIPEKIPGSEFILDLARLAAKENKKIYLLGGRKGVAEKASKELQRRFPGLEIAGASDRNPDDPNSVREINESDADFLFVAYGQVKQEKWISTHLPELNISVAIGVGGSFDYLAGTLRRAPNFLRSIGLEWLFRLIREPKRVKRIYRAVFAFSRGVVRHKVFMTMPYRQNVVGVIINKENKIFVGSRIIKRSRNEVVLDKLEPWQFPQGGVDPGETPERAVLREVREETGLDNLKILGQANSTHQYDWAHGRRELFFNRFKNRGQQQQIFFLEYQGDGSEINLAAHDQEFSSYKWVDLGKLEETVHPFRKPVVRLVYNELKEIISEREKHGRE